MENTFMTTEVNNTTVTNISVDDGGLSTVNSVQTLFALMQMELAKDHKENAKNLIQAVKTNQAMSAKYAQTISKLNSLNKNVLGKFTFPNNQKDLDTQLNNSNYIIAKYENLIAKEKIPAPKNLTLTVKELPTTTSSSGGPATEQELTQSVGKSMLNFEQKSQLMQKVDYTAPIKQVYKKVSNLFSSSAKDAVIKAAGGKAATAPAAPAPKQYALDKDAYDKFRSITDSAGKENFENFLRGNDNLHNADEVYLGLEEIKRYKEYVEVMRDALNGGLSPSFLSGKLDEQSLNRMISSLQGIQEQYGTKNQTLMVQIQDLLGQYNANVQGANAAVQQSNNVQQSIAKGG